MKELHGQASQAIDASPQEALELLADLESYPRWYPSVVRGIEVVEREGERITQARATLQAAVGPINRELALLLAVTLGADTVRLARVPHERSDRERFEVTWRVAAQGPQRTHLELALYAALDLPRLLPTGGLADSMAAGFVGAAARQLAR